MEHALEKIISRQRTHDLLEIASAGDRVSRIVDIGLIVLILLSVIAILLESVNAINNKFHVYFYYFEVFCIFVFTVEYILRIWSCVDSEKYINYKNNFITRIRYSISFSSIIDLLAILPFYLMMFGLFGNMDLRFLRSFRLLRIFKLTRYSAAFDVLSIVFKENLHAFGAALFVLIITMLLASSGMYYFEHDAQPSEFSSIFTSMWWAFATLTTVGYGDIIPVTTMGKVFGAVITVVGVGMVALPTAIMASAFSEQLRIRASRYEHMADKAYEDGVLTEDEINELDNLREDLGLTKGVANQILANEENKVANIKMIPESICPHCGNSIIMSSQLSTAGNIK